MKNRLAVISHIRKYYYHPSNDLCMLLHYAQMHNRWHTLYHLLQLADVDYKNTDEAEYSTQKEKDKAMDLMRHRWQPVFFKGVTP